MKKMILAFVIAVFIIFLLSACKEKETPELSVPEDDKEGSDAGDSATDGDDVSTDSIGASDEDSDTDGDKEQNTDSTDDENNEYGPIGCGDAVCQYYETNSNCPEDCEKFVDLTLDNYPDFLEDVMIVIGDDAPSMDALTAVLIGSYLVTVDITSETILASELHSFDDADLIMIGSPCNNEAMADFYHYDGESCDDIISEQNNAVIKLTVQDTNEVITITGYDEENTRSASQMLTDASYNINGAEEWVNLVSDGTINVYYSKN